MKLGFATTLGLMICSVIAVGQSAKVSKPASIEDENERVNTIEDELEQLLDMKEELEADIKQIEKEKEEKKENVDSEEQGVSGPMKDPCENVHCGAGRECIVAPKGEGWCQCVQSCAMETETRRKVCSNNNETFPSDCELYRQRCLCADASDDCRNQTYKHMHIDYYGECQEQAECLPSELEDFPRRIREWLFNVMRDMADRQALNSHFLKMEQEAEIDPARKWVNSAVWKWCELDGHPRDRAVSRHELFPFRAPLVALEHCVNDFLDSCDPDDDHKITIKEWATCLQLSDDHIDNIEELCDGIRDAA